MLESKFKATLNGREWTVWVEWFSLGGGMLSITADKYVSYKQQVGLDFFNNLSETLKIYNNVSKEFYEDVVAYATAIFGGKEK
jgi:hypothetical protein